jgi:hypothetical protein
LAHQGEILERPRHSEWIVFFRKARKPNDQPLRWTQDFVDLRAATLSEYVHLRLEERYGKEDTARCPST